jgi:hypothetical protein
MKCQNDRVGKLHQHQFFENFFPYFAAEVDLLEFSLFSLFKKLFHLVSLKRC